MSELPKIALTRLKAGSNSLPGPEHLDANILAAFAERNLPEQERAEVLNHLSQCAECREVAAFIVPPEAVLDGAPRTVESRKWNLWSNLSWGPLAAALATVAILAILYSGMWRRNHEMAVSTPPPASADRSAETLTANAPSPPSPPDVRNESDARAEAQAWARQENALKKSRESGNAQGEQQVQLQASERSTRMAASRPPVVLRAEIVPAGGIERHETLGDNAVSAASVPAPVITPTPAAPQPAGEPTTAPRTTDKLTAEPQNVPSVSESVQIEVQAPTVRRETTRAGAGAGGTAALAQAKPGAPKAAAGAREETHGAMLGMMAARKDLKLKSSAPAIAWSVSTDGNVQRSSDGAKIFYPIEVSQGVKFQAVAANGNEVWAGGENGALFHSIDDGASWTPVRIGAGDGTVKESIVAIQFPDTHHMTVVTASGAQWVSEDDGQHWKAQ
jgi:hypothetical protein